MRKQREPNTTRIHIVVSSELKEALQKVAMKQGRSLSGLVNVVLTDYIKKNAGK
jgi:hypothetical protein